MAKLGILKRIIVLYDNFLISEYSKYRVLYGQYRDKKAVSVCAMFWRSVSGLFAHLAGSVGEKANGRIIPSVPFSAFIIIIYSNICILGETERKTLKTAPKRNHLTS